MQLTSSSEVTGLQEVKISPHIMEPDSLLPHQEVPTTGPNPERD
jgi:hypothetical protein